MLTEAQAATLKALIQSDPQYSAWFAQGEGGPELIAEDLNLPASPDYWVFKSRVPNEEIGNAFNGTEVAGMSALNMQRAQMLSNYSAGWQNPSRFDRRDAFDRIFSGAGGANTRAALAVLWRRKATKLEKLFAVASDGPANANPLGGTANPATCTFEGEIGAGEILMLFS